MHTNNLALDAEGKYILVSPYDGEEEIWSTTTGESFRALGGAGEEVISVAFSGDMRYI